MKRAALARWFWPLLLALAACACATHHHARPPGPAASKPPGDSQAQAPSQFRMRDWARLSHDQKKQVLSQVINLAREQGTFIRLPPDYYVAEIDALRGTYVSTGNEGALDSSVGVTFKTIAVMEGDWDNGQGRVEQARNLLGPQLFAEFKHRHPEQYRHLIELDRRAGVPAKSD